MRIKLILIFTLIINSAAFSQINYLPLSFTNALQESKKQGKLLFVQFESASCNQCNEVADKGLSDEKVSNSYNQTFIALKIPAEHPDRNEIASRYNMENKFGSLFINNEGTLVHVFPQSTTFAKKYSEQLDLALTKAGENLQINGLEKEYKNGNRAIGFLEMLMQKRATLNLPTDSLLEEYVRLLPADSLSSLPTLIFIAKMAPALQSNAYRFLRTDRTAYNKAWYSLSMQERIRINNVIINKGMLNAIAQKDESLALQTATFAKNTNTNIDAGANAFDKNMLRFYKETNNKDQYFIKAIAYYDRYYMNISVDSVKKLDSLQRIISLKNAQKETVNVDGKIVQRAMIVSSPVSNNYAGQLNDGAWSFYKLTDDLFLLKIATTWAKRASEMQPSDGILDTYARLLYQQGEKQKAIELETKAMEFRRQRGFDTKELSTTIDKMKKGVSIR